jgi:hypothetical protein
MRRLVTFSVALGLILAAVAAGPVSAGSRQPVTMTVTTTFDESPDAFTATGIPDCDWGTVYDAGANFAITPATGVFAGYKVFDCEDSGETGFLVRLNARFGSGGSVGTWAVLDSWGSLAGMTGAGSLTGDPIENGIIDSFVGSIVL